jgi:hypothetical protein
MYLYFKWNFLLKLIFFPHKIVEKEVDISASIRHLDASTHLIGVTNAKRRKLQLSYLLLWELILCIKLNRVSWLAIGELNSPTPKCIVHFKSWLNANFHTLVEV